MSILLSNKLDKVEKISPLYKTKSDDKFIQAATKLTNEMKELSVLAKYHQIEDVLFHPSNLAKIYELVGRKRQTEFIKKHMEHDLTVRQKWKFLISFLDDEIKLTEELMMTNPSKADKKESHHEKIGPKDKPGETKRTLSTDSSSQPNARCHLCGETDHVATLTKKGRYVINYFACPKFAHSTSEQRLALIRDKGFCHQCLTPGQKKDHKGFCFKKYICPHDTHKTADVGFHVMVCGKHKNDPKNVQLFAEYKEKYITSSSSLYKDFSKNISLHALSEPAAHLADDDSPRESKMFMLQTIEVASKRLNLFYDGGCGDSTSKKSAVDFLAKIGRAQQTLKGPLVLNGVGDINMICEHGEWSVTLPMYNGEDISMRGICLDRITSEFPTYPLKKLQNDIHHHFGLEGGDPETLPKLPASVGGETDIMIGIQYLKIHPKPKFTLPNGFTIFESFFKNPDGSRGIVAGPHRYITEILQSLNQSHMSLGAYLTDMANAFRDGFRVSLDVSLLNGKDLEVYDVSSDENTDDENLDPGISSTSFHTLDCPNSFSNPTSDSIPISLVPISLPHISPGDDPEVPISDTACFVCGRRPKLLERFEEIENAGTEVPYRCVKCRNCEDCKTGAKVECTSIREEVEQALIDKSVTVDLLAKTTTARLPFLTDPKYKLTHNMHIARKIYDRQLRQLNRSPKDKQDVLDTQNKLQSLGFVDDFDNLTKEQQNKISSSPIRYFIPWRAVWNLNSKTTECRMVFDASHPTETGVSLNDILAKGRNNMNKLLEIALRWRIWPEAFHTDVRKMYNTLVLEEEHWCYQLYLWNDELDPTEEPKWKVIKTLIYGVKSSGNQAERGIRETGRLMSAEFPRQHEIIQNDIYVDDCMSGELDAHQREVTCEGLKTSLLGGGFNLKGFTFSGFDPPPNLANEDHSINVAGHKWFSEKDRLGLNIGELNFTRKNRGKKLASSAGIIPDDFTRRNF